MDVIEPPFQNFALRQPLEIRQTRLMPAAMLAGLLAAGAVLGGCGSKVDTPLPDLSGRSTSGNGTRPLTEAEQKRAIDELIAKRDGKATASK